MTAHLPILQVVLPLIAAPLMIIARRGALAWLIAVAASAAALVILPSARTFLPRLALAPRVAAH